MTINFSAHCRVNSPENFTETEFDQVMQPAITSPTNSNLVWT